MTEKSAPHRIGADGWHSAVDVRQLRAFLAVVEHGSVRAAAEALGFAQSTISEALAALDRALGTPVLHRSRGAHVITLTETGRALLPHAQHVLQELDALHVAVARVTHGSHATVRIVANESVSTYLLAPALASLRKRWSKVQFAVTVGTCATVRAAIASGQCDLGLLLEGSADPDAVAHGPRAPISIASDVALVIFGSREHPLVRHRGRLRRDALSPYSLYLADSAGDFHELVRRYLAADGLPGPRLESVGSIESVRRGVASDSSALGLLPSYAVADDLATKRAHALTLDPPPPSMRLVALAAAAEPHPVIAQLIAELQATGSELS